MSTKVRLVKAMVFPVVMYGCESWTRKKAEHQKTDASKLWYWRRLLRAPCTTGRSNQSMLKEISPEYSLEGLLLKLKLQYFGPWCKELTHWKRPWCWERLKAGEEGDDRGWDGWMASPTWWTWDWASSGSWWWTGRPVVLQSMRLQRVHWETELIVVENPPANAGDVRDVGSNPGLGRSSGGGRGNPLQYSYLENPMDREAWKATVCGVAKSRTQLKRLRTLKL